MKIITTEQQTSTIHISEVNAEKHIVVAIIGNTPTILGKGYNEHNSALTFFILGSTEDYNTTITTGNGFDYSHEENNIEKMILRTIRNGNKIEVFRKQDWKHALQWLIDNVK